MALKYFWIVLLVASSGFGVPIEITFPSKVDTIAFPKLINTISFEDKDQELCEDGEVCRNVKDCSTALDNWKSTKRIPKTCYFKGNEHFVCCREGASPKPVGTSSNQKCNDFYPEPKYHPQAAVGGQDALFNEFPYMAALAWNNGKSTEDFLCGGVLIDYNYVLTAAHCASIDGEPPKFVRLGGRDLLTNQSDTLEIDKLVEKVIVHPKYDPNLSYYDIALVKLESSAYFLPACLWTIPSPPTSDLVALGYGHKEFAGRNSNILQKVNITLFDNEECQSFYNRQPKTPDGILENQICAGDYTASRDTCQGDSGGPLLSLMEKGFHRIPQILGITSFGSTCADGVPGVYTRVSEYIDWIEESMS